MQPSRACARPRAAARARLRRMRVLRPRRRVCAAHRQPDAQALPALPARAL